MALDNIQVAVWLDDIQVAVWLDNIQVAVWLDDIQVAVWLDNIQVAVWLDDIQVAVGLITYKLQLIWLDSLLQYIMNIITILNMGLQTTHHARFQVKQPMYNFPFT